MANDSFHTFCDSVFIKVQDEVSRKNKESCRHLTFERISNGFRVCRETPFLAIEQCLDGNQFYGRSEVKDKSGRAIPTMFPPLTITGENEASFPPYPMRKTVALTTADVAGGVLGLF
jgi:hypothetical protein